MMDKQGWENIQDRGKYMINQGIQNNKRNNKYTKQRNTNTEIHI